MHPLAATPGRGGGQPGDRVHAGAFPKESSTSTATRSRSSRPPEADGRWPFEIGTGLREVAWGAGSHADTKPGSRQDATMWGPGSPGPTRRRLLG